MRHLGTVIFFLVAAYLIYDFTNDADRDESGIIVEGGQVDVFTARVGDCFNDPQEIEDEGTEVTNLAGLPCSEPHDNEIYAAFDVSLETYPGGESMNDIADIGCSDRFESFVGKPYSESILDIVWFVPTADSWSLGNDREVQCAVYHIDGEKLTGSMEGSEI